MDEIYSIYQGLYLLISLENLNQGERRMWIVTLNPARKRVVGRMTIEAIDIQFS